MLHPRAKARGIRNNGIKDLPGIALYTGAFVIILAGLVCTYARGAWIAAFAGVFMILWYADKRLVVPAVMLIVAALFIFRDTSVGDRIKSSFTEKRRNSGQERMLMWKSGLLMVKDRPIIGIGTQNIHKVYPKYRQPGSFEKNQVFLHNNVVHIAVIDGIPGAAAFLWIFGALWAAFIPAIRRIKKEYLRAVFYACLCVSAGFFINGFFESNFIYAQNALMFWFLAGLGWGILKRVPGYGLRVPSSDEKTQ